MAICKKMLCCVLILVLAFNITLCPEASESREYVSVTLGNNVRENGIKVCMGNDKTVTVRYRDRREAWLLTPGYGTNSAFIYANIEDSFLYNLQRGEMVAVDVDYYDSGDGTFVLEFPTVNAATAETEIVELGDTNTWKTYRFIIADAVLANSMFGYDFRVSIYSPKMGLSLNDVLIGGISVRKLDTKRHINITPQLDQLTTKFYTGDDIVLTYDFDNIGYENGDYGKYPIDVEYIATLDGEVMWLTKETFDLLPQVKESRTIRFNVDTYGLYKMTVRASNQQFKLVGYHELVFAYVSSVKGEYVNPKCGIVSSYGQGTPPELYINAGIGGMRETASGTMNFRMLSPDSFRLTPYYRESLRNYEKYRPLIISCLINYGEFLRFKTGERTPMSDAALQEWGEFCATVARDSLGFTNKFEIWNEFDILWGAMNWDGVGPEGYVKILKTAYEAIKKVDPTAEVISFSLAGANIDYLYTKYIEEGFAYGAANYCDAVSIHPYYWSGPPKQGKVYEVIAKCFRDLMDRYGMEGKPLYATEVGWSNNYLGVSNRQQGYYLVQNYVIHQQPYKGRPLVDQSIIYRMTDIGMLRNDRESNFGLLGAPSAPTYCYPKHSYLAVAHMNVMLADADCIEEITTSSNLTYVNRFKRHRDNKDILVLWSDLQNEMVNLSLGTDNVRVYDTYGNAKDIVSEDGIYTLLVSEAPMYVEGNFSQFALSEKSAAVSVESAVYDVVENDTVLMNFINKTGKPAEIKLKTVHGSALSVVENNGFEDGRAVVKIKVGSGDFKSEMVTITVKGEGGVYFHGNVAFNIKSPIDMYLTKRYDKETGSWYMVANLANNSKYQQISGTLKIIEPERLAKSVGEAPLATVPPNGEVKVETLIPKSFNKADMIVSAVFEPSAMRATGADMRLMFDTVNYIDEPITIDGTLSSPLWQKGSKKIYLKSSEQFTSEHNHSEGYGGVEDLSAECTLLWDEQNLYFGAAVTDDIHNQQGPKSDLWRGDSIQLGMIYDPRGVHPPNKFLEIAIGMTNDGEPLLQRYTNGQADDSNIIEGYELKITRKENRTYYELKLPWKNLMADTDVITAGTEFKFSLLINDADKGTRKGWMEYGSGIAQGKNSNLFKFLYLLK